MSIPFKESDGFDVVGLREHIDRDEAGEPITRGGDQGKIARQGGGVAGNRNDAFRLQPGQEGSGFPQSLARGIEENTIESGLLLYRDAQLSFHIGGYETGIG